MLKRATAIFAFSDIGRILAQENKFEMEFAPDNAQNWKRDNLKYVVFLQENQSRRILGVNTLKKIQK